MAIIEFKITAPRTETSSIGRLTTHSEAVTMQASTTIWKFTGADAAFILQIEGQNIDAAETRFMAEQHHKSRCRP
ncbi:Uncharacterised protein [Klebsiella pneumoniae]|nr:Uncharacterised protein [Klebsiella pneumoniae]